ncbi:hypothetical protein, partial [Endozoicomonas sp. ALB091]|uniref:hypothetical protein n=1 Tax=Endozoicomonas sp. ALB091 TaxID=3403073 RepID=UPI003BB7F3FE
MLDDINYLVVAIEHNGVHFLLRQLADRGDEVGKVVVGVDGVGASPYGAGFNVLNQNTLVLDDLLFAFFTGQIRGGEQVFLTGVFQIRFFATALTFFYSALFFVFSGSVLTPWFINLS